MVSGGMACVKYLVFCFNLIFAILGLATVVLGVIAQIHIYSQYSNFVYPSYQLVPIVMISVGVIIFMISFFGCCGAVKENYCMITTFCVLVVIILVAQAVVGVAVYLKRSDVEVMLENQLNSTMYKYYTNNDIKKTWDVAQHELECCGMNGPEDWQQINHNNSLPHTCCPDFKDDGSCSRKTPNVYTASCIEKFKSLLTSYDTILLIVGISVICFQALGVIFAGLLARYIHKEYETV